MKAQGGWAKEIEVTPGRSGPVKPFGSVKATSFRSVRGWVVAGKREYDYAAIILPPGSNLGQRTGWFACDAYADSYLHGKRVNTAGYPGDKNNPPGTMWYMGLNAKRIEPRVIVYDIDTMGGQSGSAVWIRKPTGERVVVGIHTNGSSSGNSATRITKPVHANLLKWRAEGGV
jgi:V8-like Glu-specific endopeptidase